MTNDDMIFVYHASVVLSKCCHFVSNAAYVMLDISKPCFILTHKRVVAAKKEVPRKPTDHIPPSEPVRLEPTASRQLLARCVERSLRTQAVCTDTGRFTVETSHTSAHTAQGKIPIFIQILPPSKLQKGLIILEATPLCQCFQKCPKRKFPL